VITAEFDPLRDEGRAYAGKLSSSGVEVKLSNYDGMIHVFFQLSAILDGGRRAVDEACAALRDAFS
jgi:acetyl esterase